MFDPLHNTIQGVMQSTWPMLFISVVIMVSLRATYLIKNKQPIVFYKEMLMLFFMVYILCLFQVVTFQDVSNFSHNNFIPFREITRYSVGSRLFFKNVCGNILLFIPFGLLISIYLKPKNIGIPLAHTLISSLAIEFTQMVIGRSFDVDDILLNCIGGIIGYFIYKILDKIGDMIPNVLKSKWFLNILTVVLLVGLVVYLFFI